MKKSIILLVTVAFLGIAAADAALHQPAAAYAAAQAGDSQTDQPKNNQGGKDDGHTGHH